eukprot:scaffold22638_cov138-Cylindrotheca_fusiformis.AAC.11
MKTILVAASLIHVGTGLLLPRQGTVDSPRLPRQIEARPRLQTAVCSSITSSEELRPAIEAIDAGNGQLSMALSGLRSTPYFRLYSVDILASCEYLPQDLFECYSDTCEVYPVDDDEVPKAIRSTDYDELDFELDGWGRWDMPSNDYYDIEQFPEGYTGYDGSIVWDYIHRKICFEGYGEGSNHWKANFNKAVSGVHSIVSAQVIRGIQERVDDGEPFTNDEVWRDPSAEFSRRMGTNGETPLAMENLYFTYMLLLSAVAKARDRLLADCQTGRIDHETASTLTKALSVPLLENPAIEVVAKKLQENSVQSASDLWEARMRSRELLRIINCVQCNKCRLHGKIAMMGLSTALQINMGRDGRGEDPNAINRVELAALVTTLYKASRAVDLCQGMKQ